MISGNYSLGRIVNSLWTFPPCCCQLQVQK